MHYKIIGTPLTSVLLYAVKKRHTLTFFIRCYSIDQHKEESDCQMKGE